MDNFRYNCFMIQWLKDYGFLAGWLTLPLAVVLFIAQNQKTHFKNIDLSRWLVYIAFSVSLGLSFTPSLDTSASLFARNVLFFTLVFIMVDRKPRV